MEFTSGVSEQRYERIVAAAAKSVVGLDFDGVLSPIVDDPARAFIHPEAPAVLIDLAEVVLAVSVITGRPARQVLALGGLDEVGMTLGDQGRELFVFGQYGNERWSSSDRRVISPRPPPGLAGFLRDLPAALRRVGAAEAHIEEKGLAVAVHTRRLDAPDAVFARVMPALSDLAADHDLIIEPGRLVVEVRSPGKHKGHAVDALVAELDASGFVFIGDDLGDLDAFDAVDQLSERGMATLLVCSASEEQTALAERADVVVSGPDGVLRLLRQFTVDAG
ncbi:MAG: trehalose-phosphatase [Nocardioides sp.]